MHDWKRDGVEGFLGDRVDGASRRTSLGRVMGAAMLLAGCSTAFTVDGGEDAGSSGTEDAGSEDAGARDAGSPDAGRVEPPEGDYESFIRADQTTLPDGSAITDLLAVFFAKDPGDIVIEREPVGSCELSRTIDRPPAGFELVEDADVGPIRLRAGERVVDLSKGTIGYTPTRLDEALFAPGEPVTVSAAGRDRFSSLQVELDAPSPVGLETPPLPTVGALEVPSDEDLPIRWTGGSSGQLSMAFIFENRARGETESIRCRYPAAAGEGVVPAAVFRRIADDATDASDVTVSVETRQVVSTRIEGWPATITVELTAGPTSPSPFSLSVRSD